MAQMPTVFLGHGSPMIALENNELTEAIRALGEEIIEKCGRPKAILAVSAHWFTHDTFVQSNPTPRQIYDMYGFPEELYALKYPVQGSRALTDEVLALLGEEVSINDEWGIDHGSWSVLVHMFEQADIPVVQLSVNSSLGAPHHFNLGVKLSALRKQGYLILGSGNIVHNLARLEWDNSQATPEAYAFDEWVTERVINGETQAVIEYQHGPAALYAVPYPDHYLPLLYPLGAARGEAVRVFNHVGMLGSITMTSFTFGL